MTSDKTLTITVLGGTGFTGGALVRTAHARGHLVTSISRTPAEDFPDEVTQVTGSVLDDGVLQRAVQGADVVISALSPRGDLFDRLAAVDARLAELAADAGVRLGVIGGFSSLRPAAGAPRMAEGEELPPEFAAEAKQMLAVLTGLEDGGADWFFIAPPMGYGVHSPAESRGTWRTGGDVASFDPERAALSADDFAGAVLDEAQAPTVHRAVLSVSG